VSKTAETAAPPSWRLSLPRPAVIGDDPWGRRETTPPFFGRIRILIVSRFTLKIPLPNGYPVNEVIIE
jgi:hypothetical protein